MSNHERTPHNPPDCTHTQNPNNKDITMSNDKTPTTPTATTKQTQTTGEDMQPQDTAPTPNQHHQHYVYGTSEEEWIPGTYRQPWFWASPEVLPISPNFHGYWEKMPDQETISQDGLATFIERATPISKEEYDRLISIKRDRQHADDDMEYRWYGPRYDDED